MLAEVLALPEEPEQEMPFADMDTHWSRPYVLRALAAGVIRADDYGENLGPDQVIPREEMAYLLVPARESYAASHPEIIYPDLLEVPPFSDESEIDPRYAERVKKCAALGLLKGYPEGDFGPKRGLSRGEAATVLTRLMGVSGSGTQVVVSTPRPGAVQEEGSIVVLGSAAAFEGTRTSASGAQRRGMLRRLHNFESRHGLWGDQDVCGYLAPHRNPDASGSVPHQHGRRV